MKKSDLLIYRISTAIFTLLIAGGAAMYFAQYDQVSGKFAELGFPTYIVYPLAIAKILGLVAIWTNRSKMLKEWAYAGFTFDFLLAISAHINISDGEQYGAMMALVLMAISYYFYRKVQYPVFAE